MFNPWGIKWFIIYVLIIAIMFCNSLDRTDLAMCFAGGLVAFLTYQFFGPTIEEKLHKGWTDQIIKKLEDEMNKKVKK